MATLGFKRSFVNLHSKIRFCKKIRNKVIAKLKNHSGKNRRFDLPIMRPGWRV